MAEEIGYQNGLLPTWATISAQTHEANPDLLWPESINVFDKMRREDAQVASVFRAVTLPIRSTKWEIDPAGARDEVVKFVATDLGLPIKGQDPVAPLRTRGRFSFREHLRLALLELVYGHSYFEQVYRIERDADGNFRAHLGKLAWRPPRTISNIKVAGDGGLISIEQYGKAGKPVEIPVTQLVAYVNEREGANWIGQSVLRSAYKNWLLKDRELRAQALTIERNGLGVPVYTSAPVPDGMTGGDAKTWQEEEKAAGLKIAKDFRAGEQSGASLRNGAKLELIGVTGDLPDTEKPIRYQDEQIARAVLAHFLNLGTETGSWALGSTFADFFANSLNAVADQVADTFNQHVIEDVVDANWGESEPAPRLVPAAIGSEHPATAEAIKSLIDAKALTPDEQLESHLRALYGLPVKDAATSRVAPVEPEEAA